MKETGMLFTSPMVRAILEGRKTQSRRIVRPAPETDQRLQPITTETGLVYARSMEKIDYPNLRRIRWESPVGQPGDRIYVRETFSQHPEWGQLAFRADGEEFEDADGWLWEPKWIPSIHMPKDLARIWLEITGVRLERIQDISEADAIAEGVNRITHGREGSYYSAIRNEQHPKNWIYPDDAFRELWESTGGDWNANPCVWAIDFKVLSTTGRPA